MKPYDELAKLTLKDIEETWCAFREGRLTLGDYCDKLETFKNELCEYAQGVEGVLSDFKVVAFVTRTFALKSLKVLEDSYGLEVELKDDFTLNIPPHGVRLKFDPTVRSLVALQKDVVLAQEDQVDIGNVENSVKKLMNQIGLLSRSP